jgi:hypothetical protein
LFAGTGSPEKILSMVIKLADVVSIDLLRSRKRFGGNETGTQNEFSSRSVGPSCQSAYVFVPGVP